MAETTKPAVGNPNLRVIIVDDESTKIPEVLGITPERENELDVIIKEYFENRDTITDTIAEISRYVRHANELAYCVFHVGVHIGKGRAMEAHLGGLLGALKKGLGGNSSEESND